MREGTLARWVAASPEMCSQVDASAGRDVVCAPGPLSPARQPARFQITNALFFFENGDSNRKCWKITKSIPSLTRVSSQNMPEV